MACFPVCCMQRSTHIFALRSFELGSVGSLLPYVKGAANQYFSFASTIFTVTTVGFGVGVGLGGDVGVGVGVGGVVAVGVEVVAVPPPPHAAKRSAAMIANEKNTQDNRAFLAKDDSFLFMFM